MKNVLVRLAAVIGVAMLLAGCGLPKSDQGAETLAREAYTLMSKGDPALRKRLAPESQTAETYAALETIPKLMPAGAPKSVKTVGWNTATVNGQTTVTLRHVYEYDQGPAYAETLLRRDTPTGPWMVVSFNFNRPSAAAVAANKLTLFGKSPAQLAFMAVTILSPLLMIAALIKVIRRKGLKRKWLWGILAFLTLFTAQMNWATGETAFQFFRIGFVSTGITSAGFGSPWILSLAFPVGALLILFGVWANPPKTPEAEPATEAPRTEPAGS